MREYGFELQLCATLEHRRDGIIARQLGGAVEAPGARVMDVVHVATGPEFDDRVALTPATIPAPIVEADLGTARWQPVTEVLATSPERARRVAERAAELGVIERKRRDGRTVIRRAAPYPDWIGSISGIENKPDLGTPGELAKQVRMDIAVSVFDRVVVATASHVTGAHLNRLPTKVGVWEFDPADRSITVVREATPLDSTGPGTEIRDEHPLRTDITCIEPPAKARARRRIGERAYGKGWRPDQYPECDNCTVTRDGLPQCTYFDRIVEPNAECGSDCPGYEAGRPPGVDVAALRAKRTAWDPDPPPIAREQAPLTRFDETKGAE